MRNFEVVALSRQAVAAIREQRVDAYGHAVMEQTATGAGPCRVSLQPFRKGIDKRLVFSYSPFEQANAYDQPGPVFINAEDVAPYSDIRRFPPEIKADKKRFPLTLIGYSKDQQMVHSQLVGDQDVEDLIEALFASKTAIDYLHVRNAEACCYICRINRIVSE
ncbi:MAG TPA: DUF1203 domain-containing protein [Flavisolibacter sp.]|jgi:hypothetical protein|nr:DUF1203 domain-containing protein [Flavisolibacter sp.]